MGLKFLQEWKHCGGAGSKLGRVFGGGRKTSSRTNKHSSSSSSSSRKPQQQQQTATTSSPRIPNRPSSSSSMALGMGTRGELEEVFRKFDRDGDGRISSAEVADVLRSLGTPASEEEVGALMAHADLNGDGFIDVAEFVAVNSAQPQPSSSSSSSMKKTAEMERGEVEEVMRSAFGIFDANGDGVITAEELQRVMACIGEPCSLDDCRTMIRRVDMDGDGHVNFHEFRSMMASPPTA